MNFIQIKPALLGVVSDGRHYLIDDDQGKPIAPSWQTDSSGNVTGLLGPNGAPVDVLWGELTVNGNADITGDTTLGDASTDTVTVKGYIGVGGAGSSDAGITMTNNALAGAAQSGMQIRPVATSSATTSIRAIVARSDTAAASFTVADAVNFWAAGSTKGAGSTITNQHGLYITDQTQGTNNYGITSLVSADSNKWNIYASGTAANYFAGNVGIGTSSPGQKLEVSGSVRVSNSVFLAASGVVNFNSGNDENNKIGVNADAGSLDYNTWYVHRFFTNSGGNAERMCIDYSGNVGIGTASPGTKLHVYGAGTTSTAYTNGDAAGATLYLQDSNGGSGNGGQILFGASQGIFAGIKGFITDGIGPAGNLLFQTRSSSGNVIERMRIDSSGTFILKGTDTGNQQQFWMGGSERARIGINASNGLDFAVGLISPRMTITSSGNVLIGTTSGGYLLTVAAGRGGFSGGQNVGTLRNAGGDLGGLECRSASNADAAFMSFHKPGNYASYFGLDTDNWFAVGGWSAGAGLANFKCSALSKASGSFKIDHPLPEKTETHHLVHSFVEAPQADNIYRGKVTLVDGYAEINIDESAGMTEGTFVALNREVQCFTSNESHWDAVRGSVNGNILTIECQSTTSTATVSWLVIGERQDKHMYDTGWTDENGKVIVEPLKPPKPQPIQEPK